MRRRTYLATFSSTIALTAGCNSNRDVSITAVDPDPTLTEAGLYDGPNTGNTEKEIDESRFKTYDSKGTLIKQVPIDIAVYWHRERKARFLDARTVEQYQRSHIEDAIHSPAPNGKDEDGVEEFGENERIVTYCTCPHHLSGIRAAELMDAGYGAYALYEGFEPWARSEAPTYRRGGVEVEEYVDDYSNLESE